MSLQIPELPYNGTSGWSGTDTSRDRAKGQDLDGRTSRRQMQTLTELGIAGQRGLTWKELADRVALHHGSASGVLSVLHLAKRIARLHESRNQCKVYVLHEFINGRKTEERKAKKCCPHCGGNL
jgi:hypothetical protein